MPVTTTQRDSLQSDHVSMTLPQNSGMESLSLLGYFWPKLAQQHKKRGLCSSCVDSLQVRECCFALLPLPTICHNKGKRKKLGIINTSIPPQRDIL